MKTKIYDSKLNTLLAKRPLRWLPLLTPTVLAGIAILSSITIQLHAAPKTWRVGSGNWGTGASWSGGTVPQAGDDLIFPSRPLREMTNNPSEGRVFRSLTFSSGGNFLSGNGLVVTGYVTANCSSGLSDLGITVDADGAALAAIQGLNQKLGEREADLRRDLERKELEIEALKSRLEKLEQLIQAESARQP